MTDKDFDFISLENIVEIDGSNSEGGGQILRTSLGLSILTGRPFLIKNIRKGRPKVGLKQQHTVCVEACKEISQAIVKGNQIGSEELLFIPRTIKNRNLEIDIKTAGSTTLVLQSVLLPFLFTNSEIKLTGGTDVPWSIPVDYFKEILCPILNEYSKVEMNFEKRGFYPEGNGIVYLKTKHKTNIKDFDNFEKFHEFIFEKPALNLTQQGNIIFIKGISFASKSLEKYQVAEKIGKTASLILKQITSTNITYNYSETPSKGFGMLCYAIYNFKDDNSEIKSYRVASDMINSKDLKPEELSRRCAENLISKINKNMLVDENLQDNLIPLLALFGGKIKVQDLTGHTLSNIMVCEKFLKVKFNVDKFNDKDNNNIVSHMISVNKL